jgi:hypothetical protein
MKTSVPLMALLELHGNYIDVSEDAEKLRERVDILMKEKKYEAALRMMLDVDRRMLEVSMYTSKLIIELVKHIAGFSGFGKVIPWDSIKKRS